MMKICSKCGSKNIVSIEYGLPTNEAAERFKKGEIILGGCCPLKHAPNWHCKHCGNEWE
jgi:hypothetical protein